MPPQLFTEERGQHAGMHKIHYTIIKKENIGKKQKHCIQLFHNVALIVDSIM